MTRCFIAIDPGEDTRNALMRMQSSLRIGRVMDGDTLHLTLAFLGDQSDAALEDLHDALSGVRGDRFKLGVSGLGTFGREAPHTLWVGVADEPGLITLQAKVARAARRVGIAVPARRFVPHITIARLRPNQAANPELTRFIEANAGISLPPEPVVGFTLYASTLRPEGALHEPLAQYPLS